jgi:hypothetical protein
MLRNTKLKVVAAALGVSMVAVGGAASASSPSTPATVTATAMASTDKGSNFAHRGNTVHAAQLTIRSFVNANDGFALASVGEAQYPANTTDGGKAWRIDGPHFHVNAANAPDVVTRTGVVGSSTYFAYGGGGNTVVVSSDAGNHWWRAYFSGSPLTVEPTAGSGKQPALVTIVEDNPGKFLAYVSTDGGHHWQLHKGWV